MTGKEKTAIVNDILQPIFFPWSNGDVLFDVVKKRKATLIRDKKEYGVGGNQNHFKVLFIEIRYDGESENRKISQETLHKRFLPIEQLLALWNEYDKYIDSWLGTFISNPRKK